MEFKSKNQNSWDKVMVIRKAIEHPGYSVDDRARYLDEPAKRGGRTEFA